MNQIFLLSIRQLISRWRLIILLFLAVLPIVLGTVMASLADDEPGYIKDYIDVIIDGLITSVLLPIIAMVLATMSFRHEIEDRTLIYLITKPIPRWKISLPKLAAVILVGGLIIIVSAIISTIIGPESGARALIAVGVGLFIGLLTYSVIFIWAGLVSSHALGFALIYVFLWEALVTSFLEGTRYLSIRGYVLAIIHGIDGQSFKTIDHRVIEFPVAVILPVMIIAVFSCLTIRRLSRMDVP